MTTGLTLLLRCADLGATRAFYAGLPDFRVEDSAQTTLTARLGRARLIFTTDDLWDAAPHCTGTFYLSVADVDDYHARGAPWPTLRWPLQDMPYGSREFGIVDCNGYTLAFQQACGPADS